MLPKKDSQLDVHNDPGLNDPGEINRSKLSALYPSPKSYEERQKDDELREALYRRRWPKHPSLSISVYGTFTVGVFLWFIQNIATWWFSGTSGAVVMSIVFFTSAICLVVLGLFFAWARYVNKMFSYFGGLQVLFWIIYTTITGVLFSISLSGWMWEHSDFIWIFVFGVFQFIFTMLIAKVTLDNR